MVGRDTDGTQPDLRIGIAAELAAAGLADAREIGRGGFGVVYRCVEHSLDRLVAVKVLDTRSNDDERARFLREQRALGRFAGHPHIVQVLSADATVTGRPYLVMPFYPLGSLRERIREHGPLPWQEVLSIGVKIAGALAAAHVHGIVHRDVNPANILLSDYGEPLLSDFGIAHISGAFETGSGMIAGTPAFTAPEVLRGNEPTEAADIYGLGATLFCLLTGHAAFERREGESMVAQFVRITSEPIPDLRADGIPALLCSALESAMAQDVSDRPGTAREFGDRLRNVQFVSGLAVDSMALPADGAIATVAPPVPVPVSRPVPAPTPSTRYRPPSSPRRPVRRARLLDRLRAGPPRRLMLIHGPAGFGKSTLAAEWVDVLAAEGVRVAWLSVDDDDDNVVWFLSHVVEAIRYAHPGIAADLERLLEEHASDAARHVMTSLIDEIHRAGETVALVIDDWHRVTSPATIAAMEFLLDHGCHHLRVIVTSRNRTGLPLGRMRVRDELDEIDESALRFDDAETAAFLADVSGLTLADAEVERLRASTEGWAAALQLASMSLRDRDDPGAYIDQISGRHYAIGEYLMENVVDTLEPELLECVMRTSVAERVNGELAEALTGVPNGQDMLEQVRQRDLFLRSIDDDLRWFRYHTLFADFLRDRLIRLHPGLLEELHRTAADWFAEHDMLAEAVDHLLAAGEPRRATELVAEHGERLMEQSRMGTLLGLAAKLPGSLAASNPRLQVQIGWANVAMQRPAAAATALECAEKALAGLPEDAGRADLELELEVKLVHTALSFATDQTMVLAPELVAARDSVRPFMAHGLAVGAMISALYRFDYAEVHRWHRWIEPFRDRVRGPFGAMYCDCVAGSAAYEQLEIGMAETRFRTALAGALQTGGGSQATRLASALLGELLYEKGQFIEAEELLAGGIGLEGGAVEFLMASYGIGARLAAVRGDLDTVRERLDEGGKLATNLMLPRLAARILNERIRLGLPVTDTDRTDLAQLEPYSAHPDVPSAVAAELSCDSAIRLLLMDGTEASAAQAVSRAQRLAQVIATQHRPRALVNAELLHGCCLSATGKTAEAAKFLEPAMTRCAEQGLVRLVVDSGRQLYPVVETLYGATTSTQNLVRLFLRQVLTEFEGVLPARGTAPGTIG
ncbi:Non-specific serine/threonine protein kinase [Nocardia seriolae]|uniref:Serine/threonine-protein kinase PknK n=1 Tax=Nocardia seriolae TaxID=37332 RepID=A0ABC8ASP2_9NOCA|nr:serine/threonine-protein kinase [Nocardia seriolae]APA97193.1 Non-specific serine/threonine protein kinase [Nocardia seriolae]